MNLPHKIAVLVSLRSSITPLTLARLLVRNGMGDTIAKGFRLTYCKKMAFAVFARLAATGTVDFTKVDGRFLLSVRAEVRLWQDKTRRYVHVVNGVVEDRRRREADMDAAERVWLSGEANDLKLGREGCLG